MNARSRYAGTHCMHCHQRVAKGRAALASTYYVNPEQPYYITAYSRLRTPWLNRVAVVEELELRVVYHRACIEKILAHAPEDPTPAATRFERYRDGLVQRYVDGE